MNPLLLPFQLLALASGAKSFTDNPFIGSRRLNEAGLHVARVRLAHHLAWRRRAKLARAVEARDREAFERDGFVLRHPLLPEGEFQQLRAAILAHRAPAREMTQGDTVTRRIAIDASLRRAVPALDAFMRRTDWQRLVRYVGSFDQEPLCYVQVIRTGCCEGPPDPQTVLHADTFHPSVKAWYFLNDVAADAGPFVYVPGSHRLNAARLAWERQRSIDVLRSGDRYSARGSLRITAPELERLGYAPPRALGVPANTLVVADTFGFHARGPSARPVNRIELWAYGRRNPFLPWTGLDPLSAGWIAPHRIPAFWRTLEVLEKLGVRGNPWRDAGLMRPLD
jgi:hypothetical protein